MLLLSRKATIPDQRTTPPLIFCCPSVRSRLDWPRQLERAGGEVGDDRRTAAASARSGRAHRSPPLTHPAASNVVAAPTSLIAVAIVVVPAHHSLASFCDDDVHTA